MRILFVDADLVAAELVGRALALDGLPCVVVSTLDDARARLDAERFDVVFLDRDVCESGFEAWSSIAAVARGAVMVGTSTSTDEGTVRRAFEVGGAAFLGKPYDVAWLAPRVRELVAFAKDGRRPVYPPTPRYDAPPQLADFLVGKTLHDLLAAVAAWFGVPVAMLTELDGATQHVRGSFGQAGDPTSRDLAFCAYTTSRDEVFVVEDATQDARFASHPHVTGPPHLRFYAGAPVHVAGARPRGALCLIDHVPRTLGPVERSLLAALAAHVGALASDPARQAASFAEHLLSEAGEWVATVDGGSNIRFSNPAWQRGFGHGDVVGRTLCDLFAPEDRGRLDEAMSATLDAGSASLEVQGVRSDDVAVPLSVTLRRVGVGSSTLVLVVARDVTARRAVDRRRRLLLRTLATEIRAPLLEVRGVLDALAIAGGSDEGRTAAREAAADARRALLRLEDLLALQADAVEARARVTSIDPEALLAEAVRAAGDEAVRKAITLVVRRSPSLPVFRADRSRVLAVLDRLVLRAARAAGPGAQLEVWAEAAPGSVTFVVAAPELVLWDPTQPDTDLEVAHAFAESQGGAVSRQAGRTSVTFPTV